MNKIIRTAAIIAALAAITFTACSKEEKIAVESITIDQALLVLEVGEQQTIAATIAPEMATNKTVTWLSSDESTVVVDNATGKVTAKKVGSATITASTKDGNKTATCIVNVVAAGRNSITFVTTKNKGETITLTVNTVNYAKFWIDLNGNGSEDQGEVFENTAEIPVTIGDVKTITIYGEVSILWLEKNDITAIDLSKNPILKSITCNDNQLKTLDVSKNLGLEGLNCSDNQLSKLDVSKNVALVDLYCGGNSLAELNVLANSELEVLECNNNKLTSLDVSKNLKLKMFVCSDNQIKDVAMSALVRGMPGRSESDNAEFKVFNADTADANQCVKANVEAAKAKKWTVQQYKDGSWTDYDGL